MPNNFATEITESTEFILFLKRPHAFLGEPCVLCGITCLFLIYSIPRQPDSFVSVETCQKKNKLWQLW